jgi:hypothetical protein
MNIAPVNTNTAVKPSYLSTQNIATSKTVANSATSTSKISNADGDTLKLSGNVAAKYASYAPPKPAGNVDPLLSNPEIKSFLEKVANGTANTDDLEDMQSVLQKELGSAAIASSDPNPIKNFLLKVANGTANPDDLKNMQGVIQKQRQQATMSVNNSKEVANPTLLKH